jgi:hypothetical protein
MSDEAPQIDLTTGIDGLEADDRYKNTPVFDVSSEDFFKNMRAERKRLSFTSSEKPHKFMQGTKYRQPFYIRYTDKNKGVPYLSKIK